jgi:predicted DNA-binding protein with PD1-like motif
MRSLVQPGPVSPARIESFPGRCEKIDIVLQRGLTLAEAISQPLVAAGVQAATVRVADFGLEPLRYVMPGPPDGPAHVAYFSAPRAPAGRSWIELACVTFGCMDGVPRLHCHATWVEQDGAYRGGHILLDESIVATTATARAWTFRDVGICAESDPETNFPLLRPVKLNKVTAANAVLARVRPNEDICTAVETIARRHDLRDAVVRGSLGSLIGARFADGRMVTDHATEVLVRSGEVHDGIAAMDLAVVDMQGRVHNGRLLRGDNPVCITFDLVLEDAGAANGG